MLSLNLQAPLDFLSLDDGTFQGFGDGCLANFRGSSGSSISRSQILLHSDSYYWSATVDWNTAQPVIGGDESEHVQSYVAMVDTCDSKRIGVGWAIWDDSSAQIEDAFVAFPEHYGAHDWLHNEDDPTAYGAPTADPQWFLLLESLDSEPAGQSTLASLTTGSRRCPTTSVTGADTNSTIFTAGTVAGIVCGSVAAAALLVFVIVYRLRRGTPGGPHQPTSTGNAPTHLQTAMSDMPFTASGGGVGTAPSLV
jgi:hypothetical protein